MLNRTKYFSGLLPLFFLASFANAGSIVMQGNFESSVISPRCSWLNNTPFKSLMCDRVKVIEYSTYDRPGLVTYFNSNQYTLSTVGNLPTISSKSSFDNLAIAGDTVMQGDYQTNTINTSKCGWTNSTPFKTLYCGGAKVVQYVTQPYAGLYPGQINYFDDTNFVSVTHNNVKTIFYKSPFSDRKIDNTLTGTFSIFTADGKLDKPVIMVEAYDPDNTTSPDMLYNDKWGDNPAPIKVPKEVQFPDTGLKKLVYDGRDLIVVNFPNGGGNLDANAALLQKIIQEINARKIGTYPVGAKHPTAVIGHSMGGIIAKRALKNMENAGVNHQTSVYVSYDVPHIGANVPLTIQESIDSMITKWDESMAGTGMTPSSLSQARNYYSSDAAREMLISGINYSPATSASFPSLLTRVAVTSGSMTGAMQEPSFAIGQEVAFFKIYFINNFFGQFGMDIHWISKPNVEVKTKKSFFYDNVPGSFEYQFDKALEILYSQKIDMYTPLSKDHPIAFAPTTSALAIQGNPNVPARDSFKYYSPFDKFIAIDSSTDPYLPQNYGKNIPYNTGCGNYDSQSLVGANGHHTLFYPTQLNQLVCALNEFHKIGATIPDRSFKSL